MVWFVFLTSFYFFFENSNNFENNFTVALNLSQFPFDIQKCSIHLESWTYEKDFVVFDNASQALIDNNFKSSLWRLCSYHTTVISKLKISI